MSQVMRPTALCAAVLGLALPGLGTCATTAARAADVGPPVYGPAPYPAPNYGAGYGAGYGGPCRIVLDRRIDPYGREIVQRVRVCDEGAMYPPQAPVVAPGYGYPPPGYYGPQPSEDYAYPPPRPPAPIWPGYYN